MAGVGLVGVVSGCNAIFGLDEVEPLTSSVGGGGAGGQGGAPQGGGGAVGGNAEGGSTSQGGGGSAPLVGSCAEPIDLPIGAFTPGTLVPATDVLGGGCGAGVDSIYRVQPQNTGTLLVEIYASADLALAFRDSCDDGAAVPACCSASPSAGCSQNTTIESCVCAADSDCCQIGWEASCGGLIATGCGNGTVCPIMGCANYNRAGRPEQLVMPVVSGETYFLQVEGAGPNDAGTFNLRAELATACNFGDPCPGFTIDHSCQQSVGLGRVCLPENSCQNARIALPGTNLGNTSLGHATHRGSCAPYAGSLPAYANGQEEIWQFTKAQAGTLQLQIDSAEDHVLYMRYDDCEDASAEVKCANNVVGAGMETITVVVPANQAMFIFVDTLPGAAGAAYTLTLTES